MSKTASLDCPYCGKVCDSFTDKKEHIEENHLGPIKY